MPEFAASFALAGHLIGGGDARLAQIVSLSLGVSLGATLVACALGMPLGAWLAVGRFPGRHALIVAFNALMGLPSVVAGLLLYLLLSRAGPLGGLGLLFTPTAIVIAQTFLIAPLVIALTRQLIESEWREYREHLRSLGASRARAVATLLWDGRFALSTIGLAGFGRAIAEVGAVMIVGGNIDGVTRVMTTSIALETSKGDLPLALALSLILMTLVMGVNLLAALLRLWAERRWG